jgi:hypothetical protein
MRTPLPLTLSNLCRAGCENTPGLCAPQGFICDLCGTDLCVQCLADGDCGGGQSIDLTRDQDWQGFECRFVQDPVRGKQCLPGSSVVEDPTCSAYRDLIDDKACIFNAQYGATGYSDALCADVDVDDDEQCTLPCAVDGDCPAAYTRGPSPAGSGAPGACAPGGL